MIDLKSLLLEEAAYYDGQMNPIKLKAWAAQLANIPVAEVFRAMCHYRGEKGRREMPRPADLIAFLNPTADSKDLARDTAMRVQHAVSKFGWNNPRGAREYIGDAGWVTVERFGGWEYVCANLGTELQVTTFIAQCRDSIESQVNLQRMGFNPALPAIEQSRETKRGQGLTQIGDVIKNLLPTPKDVK